MWINSWYSIRCNIRFAHSTVHTILDNDDGIKEIAKCLDNIKFQQSETGNVDFSSKTFLSQWTVPNTMVVNLLHFYYIRNKYIV